MAGLAPDGDPLAVYEIAGCHYEAASPGFADAIARAHAMKQRPRCTCMPGGIETYIAKLNGGYVVKRMPETGNQHATACPHFETAVESSSLGSLLGTAIREDPVTGLTTLKLDFILSRSPPRLASGRTSVSSTPTARGCPRLSLRALLLYLWEQAGLTRWQPGFAGKRSWAMVRRRLLQAADGKIVSGHPLLERLFLPEPFYVEEYEALSRRRAAFWAMAAPGSEDRCQLGLLVGELKELAPARCGFRAVVKQMPDQAFIVEERLYDRITRHLQPTLAMWNAADTVRMLVIATFRICASGVPSIVELSLVPTTSEWLPIDNAFEQQLIERLIAEGRSFLKNLRFGLRPDGAIACATLIDCTQPAPELFVVVNPGQVDAPKEANSAVRWAWHVVHESMPAFPRR